MNIELTRNSSPAFGVHAMSGYLEVSLPFVWITFTTKKWDGIIMGAMP